MSEAGASEPAPFVVFGASKSGTTWVQKICDAHPEVRCHFQRSIFPIDAAWRRRLLPSTVVVYHEQRSALGGVFADSEAERRYLLELELLGRTSFLQGDFVERTLGTDLRPDDLEHLRDLHARMLRGATRELLRDRPGARVYGTKAYTDLDLLFRVFPDAKVVHILRDGRDVVVSKRFHTLRQKAFYLGDERSAALRLLNRFSPTRKAVFAARRYAGVFGAEWFEGDPQPLFNETALRKFTLDWKNTVEYIRQHERRRPAQFHSVTYEALRARPEQELAKLFAFLGVDGAPETVARVVEETRFQAMRKKSGQRAGANGNGFFRRGEVGDWRNHFSAADVRLFDELAGDLLKELGYS